MSALPKLIPGEAFVWRVGPVTSVNPTTGQTELATGLPVTAYLALSDAAGAPAIDGTPTLTPEEIGTTATWTLAFLASVTSALATLVGTTIYLVVTLGAERRTQAVRVHAAPALVAATNSYFDAADPQHLALLPERLRDDSDLASLADRAEAAVLAACTKDRWHCEATVLDADDAAAAGTYPHRYVWLRGYAEDADRATPALARALRREIAGVIRWLHAQDEKAANLDSHAAGDPMTSKHYRDDAECPLPPEFGRAIGPFRIRNVAVAI